jgi:assimilatory nitrate reductase electron transfer subunit
MGDMSASADLGTDDGTDGAGTGSEVVVVSDPARGAYGKLVVRDDRLVGAILVGSPAAVGPVTQAFDRRSRLPSDRLSLLLPGRGRPADPETPERMPRTATVCRCNGITKGQIQDSVLAGARSVAAVASATRATTGCGGCRDAVEGIVEWLEASDAGPALHPVAPAPDEHAEHAEHAGAGLVTTPPARERTPA